MMMLRLLWNGKNVFDVMVELVSVRLVFCVLMFVMWVELMWFIWLVLMLSVMLLL